MSQKWLLSSINKPWLVSLSIIFLVVVASIGAKNLKFNGDYTIYFEETNPQRVAYENMQKIFNKNDNANVLIVPKTGTVFSERSLRLNYEFTESAWQTPRSNRVDSITNFQHSWAEEDDLIVENLLYKPSDISDEKIAKIQQISTTEPNLLNRLVSSDGQATIIAISINLPDGDKTAAVAEISEFLEQLKGDYKKQYPDFDFHLTGSVLLNNAFVTEAQKDGQTLVPIMFAVVIVVLWLLLKSFYCMLATIIIVATSIATTMGLSGWLGYELTTATVNVPTLVMTLAVADCVHIISSMLFLMGKGESKKQSVIKSIKLNFYPVFITSITTAIGFLTLNFSSVPALADLGNLTAIGIIIAFVYSILLLPAILILMPLKTTVSVSKGDSMIEKLGVWVVKNHKKILPVTIVIVIASLSASLTNVVNDIPTEYFDNSSEFRTAVNVQEDNIGGMAVIDFALHTKQQSGINDPANLQNIFLFTKWLKTQGEVDHVSSITDTFLKLNMNMHNDDPAFYKIPDNQELAAQFLLLYEMSLPYNLDLNNQLNIDKSATRITVTIKNLGSKEITAFESRAIEWIASNAPQVNLTAGSQSLMFAHIGEANMNGMIKGTLFALALISVILAFTLKSFRLGAISLIPNLLPAGLGFGIWAVYSGQVNMALSVVLSMALGIIVDDTVHFLSKYKMAKEDGLNTEEAVMYAFSSVGKALVITTSVLTLGFSVLATSSFALNADMGLLTCIIIVMALIIDLIFLPAFLLAFDNVKLLQDIGNEKDQPSGLSQ